MKNIKTFLNKTRLDEAQALDILKQNLLKDALAQALILSKMIAKKAKKNKDDDRKLTDIVLDIEDAQKAFK